MRPNTFQSDFYQNNRQRLASQLKSHSVAVLHSNHKMPTNADSTHPFIQNSDLFYLTGIDQEDTTLLLVPDAPNEKMKEVILIRHTDDHVLTWEGQKITKEEARKISGVETILWHHEFENTFHQLAIGCEHIYLNANEHTRAENLVKNKDEQFIDWCKTNLPLHSYQRLAPILHQLRVFKQDFEIKQIKTACDITKKGFERVAKFLKPKVFEYELEAELIHEFIRNGSKGFAYQPIIASGSNTCVLHYVTNQNQCYDGDLVLLDVASEYGNYKSDLTRVLPVNGKFNKRQKEVYQAVLNMFHYAKKILKPGLNFEEYNKAIGEKAEEELITLGLFDLKEVRNQDKKSPLYKRYFMHGISHFLGLDVHDVGNMRGKIEANMVLTCEPGIYIRKEGIGIRLENDILITQNGNLDLMDSIPIEVDEIERLMAK
jgi:Xaa-Pro aminopeptidase